MEALTRQDAIGVFDSGIGGLSVLTEIRKALPDTELLYFGDQAHVPYGARPLDQVLEFSVGITEFLLSMGACMIVVACNAASAAALKELRLRFPHIPFVGMEPALKPAAERTVSGAVGVLATPATFQGQLYASVFERFASGVKIYQDTCSGLVQEIEQGRFQGEKTRRILENALLPMIENGIDTVVLGCTHYPFVIPLIQSITGPHVQVIDPAPAVAKQTRKIFEQIHKQPSPPRIPSTTIITSAGKKDLENKITQFYPFACEVFSANWQGNHLKLNVTQPE